MKSDFVSGTKLSSEFFTDYQHYKESTAVFVHWLIDASPTKIRNLASVKQLMSLAQAAKDKNVTVPSHVLQALSSSIKKRRKITDFFKSIQDEDHTSEEEATRSHEYFTSILVDVLRLLQKDVPMHSSSGKPLEVNPPALRTEKPPNIFEVLGSEGFAVEDELESLAITEEAPSTPQSPLSSLGQAADEHDYIQDDPLADLIEVFMIVLELDAICSAVKLLWEQAGAGLIPVVLASWASSAALKGVERWLAATTTRLQLSEHQTLISKYVVQRRVLGVELRPNSEIMPKHTPFTAGHGLTTAWMALPDFKCSRQHNERLMSGRLFEDPASHITVQKDFFDGPRQMEAEHITMDLMLKTMKQLLGNDNQLSRDFVLDINPLLLEVDEYLGSDSESVSTSLVFGMQLLVESFKSFMFCDGAVQGINCRTLALKFAAEVRSSLDAIIADDCTGCKCPSCGGTDLYKLLLYFSAQLKVYLSQIRFDLYYRTPWVAGQHMQEILSLATDYGLRVCERQHYLTAILHLYNLLVQLEILQDKIPLLESLCSSLHEPVFSGSLPSRNYHSHFLSCIGGRLDFSDPSGHHNQTWRLEVPRAVRTESERKKRFVPSEISRFYDIENRRYRVDIDRWTSIYEGKKEAKATRQEKAKIDERIHSNSFAVSILQLKDYAAPEFSGDFPIARINYFAVHLGCIRILEKIASLEEDRLLKGAELPPAFIGLRFVTDLLRKVDEDQKDDFQKRLLPYLRSLRRSKEALIEVLQGKPVSEFMWQGVGTLKG